MSLAQLKAQQRKRKHENTSIESTKFGLKLQKSKTMKPLHSNNTKPLNNAGEPCSDINKTPRVLFKHRTFEGVPSANRSCWDIINSTKKKFKEVEYCDSSGSSDRDESDIENNNSDIEFEHRCLELKLSKLRKPRIPLPRTITTEAVTTSNDPNATTTTSATTITHRNTITEYSALPRDYCVYSSLLFVCSNDMIVSLPEYYIFYPKSTNYLDALNSFGKTPFNLPDNTWVPSFQSAFENLVQYNFEFCLFSKELKVMFTKEKDYEAISDKSLEYFKLPNEIQGLENLKRLKDLISKSKLNDVYIISNNTFLESTRKSYDSKSGQILSEGKQMYQLKIDGVILWDNLKQISETFRIKNIDFHLVRELFYSFKNKNNPSVVDFKDGKFIL